MPIVATGTAAAPERVVARPVNPDLIAFENTLLTLPADGNSYVDWAGNSARGVLNNAGRIAGKHGFAIRGEVIDNVTCRIWRTILTPELAGAREKARANAKARREKSKAGAAA